MVVALTALLWWAGNSFGAQTTPAPAATPLPSVSPTAPATVSGTISAKATPSPSAAPTVTPSAAAVPTATPAASAEVPSAPTKFVSPFSAKLGTDDRWTGYAEVDPLLAIYSIARLPFPKKNCWTFVAPLERLPIGSVTGIAAWGEYPEKELATITECERFPCKVKLDAAEVKKLAAEPKTARKSKYLALVEERAGAALRTGHRLGYERPEPAVDGWAFIRANAPFGLEVPAGPGILTGRLLDLAKKMGGYLEVRELLEERTLLIPGRFHRWIQDVYTDHYFDGWSEEIDFFCTGEAEGILTQTAVIDIDLLKNDDFFSKVMKPKLRHGVRENVLRMMRDRESTLFSSK